MEFMKSQVRGPMKIVVFPGGKEAPWHQRCRLHLLPFRFTHLQAHMSSLDGFLKVNPSQLWEDASLPAFVDNSEQNHGAMSVSCKTGHISAVTSSTHAAIADMLRPVDQGQENLDGPVHFQLAFSLTNSFYFQTRNIHFRQITTQLPSQCSLPTGQE